MAVEAIYQQSCSTSEKVSLIRAGVWVLDNLQLDIDIRVVFVGADNVMPRLFTDWESDVGEAI